MPSRPDIAASLCSRPSSPARRSRLLAALASAACACAALACSDGAGGDTSGVGAGGQPAGGGATTGCDQAGGFAVECIAHLDLFEAGSSAKALDVYTIDSGLVQGSKSWNFAIRNSGNGTLQISKVDFLYDTKTADEASSPAFTCQGPGGKPCAGAWPALVAQEKGGGELTFTVQFVPRADGLDRQAVIRLTSNAKDKTVTTLKFSTASGAPRLVASPEIVDFGYVGLGAEKLVDLKIFNTGTGELVISSIDLSLLDGERFAVIVEGKELAAGGVVALQPELRIAKNESASLKALYRGKDELPHTGAIRIQSNDPSLTAEGGPGIKAIPVKANSTGPCLLIKPATVVFGATAIGATGIQTVLLESCGDEPVVITAIAFDGPAGEFGIDATKLAGGALPTEAAPLTVPKNGSATLTVFYQPDAANPLKDGLPVPDLANVLMTSNIAAKTSKIKLEGVATSADCPTAIITIQEGDTVVPQTLLHLDGLQSMAPSGAVAKYKWEVTQPKGSVGLFLPADAAPQVTFQPNVAGDYVFRLKVWDAAGKESCFPAVRTVKVLPDQAIHVELLWNTPADPDQGDSGPAAGADLDLHFAHDFGSVLDFDNDAKPDPWFDAKYDCFWFNKSPEWGSYDPNIDDNPSLDRDDTDGAGPENLNLTLPEDGHEYAVGVHYYNAHGWGKSIAEVRIYIYGQLQYQVTSPDLNQGDVWYVADVAWPSANIAAKLPGGGGKFFITAKYPAPEL